MKKPSKTALPSSPTRTSGQVTPADKPSAPRQETDKNLDLRVNTQAPGEDLTTNQGVIVSDDQNSLKSHVRGPTLLEDILMREKITHFDHERIPERVVHARGTAAHGFFQAYESQAAITMAAPLQDTEVQTPVFVRFSTVAGSRGSTDTPRDVRGFAVKFYTTDGVWDLVGNNMPVFFIQDANKFPDLIHAVKPEPHNEIPQAQSAHDTFWDFASLTPESAHMLMWVMSDRAIPRSLTMMEGFGVHTFRLVNAEGVSRFVKFHWKPLKGVCSLVWEEAQLISGKDPDFNRRDLYEAIEAGNYPEWELGLQIVEEEDEHKFGFDLLDATKLIPEELVPVLKVGKMTLNRNPDNFFAETEQVAFHTGHVVPGHRLHQRPAAAGPTVLLHRHPAAPGWPQFPRNPDQPLAQARRQQPARRLCPHDHQQGQGVVLPQQPGRRLPDAPAGRGGGLPIGGGQGSPRRQGARAQPELLRSLQPGDAVLEQHERLGEGPYRGGLLLRAEPSRRRGGAQPDHERDPGEHSPRSGRDGIGRNRHRRGPRRHAGGTDALGPHAFRTAAQGRRQAEISGAQHGQGATGPQPDRPQGGGATG